MCQRFGAVNVDFIQLIIQAEDSDGVSALMAGSTFASFHLEPLASTRWPSLSLRRAG